MRFNLLSKKIGNEYTVSILDGTLSIYDGTKEVYKGSDDIELKDVLDIIRKYEHEDKRNGLGGGERTVS